MLKKNKKSGIFVILFVIISGGTLWFTVKEPSCSTKKPATSNKKSQGSNPEKSGDQSKNSRNIENKRCEHNKLTIDCDNCRFEIGVVKIQPSISKALVSTGKVEERTAVDSLQLTGEVQFDQTRVADILPACSGKVIKVNAFLGRQVKEGEVLAVIKSPDFGEAKAAYLRAFNNWEIIHQEQERQVRINNALDRVLKSGGQELNGDLMGELKSRLGAAISRLKLAQSTYLREKDLWEKQISSKSDYEIASQEQQAAQADYAALLEEIQLNVHLNKLKADNALKQSEAELNAAGQRLHTFGLSEAEIKNLPHEKSNGNFAEMTVKTPKAGTVITQNISEGKLVDTAISLYTIADLSNLWVWCDVYEKDIALLHDNQAAAEAKVKVAAFKDKSFSGRIDLIGSVLDEHTRTVKVRVQVKNDQGRLKPGMFANVGITIPAGYQITAVHQDAVVTDAGQSFVFQHLRDDLWIRRDVLTGRKLGDYIEIVDGIDKGATIVTGGAFMLKSDILREKMGAGCAD